MRARLAPLIAAAGLMAGCGGGSGQTATTRPTTSSSSTPTTTSTSAPASRRPATIATGLRVPWGIAFLPGGDALVAERPTGRILRVPAKGGTPKPVMTIPNVDDSGEGGLLGLALSPTYARDKLVYAYYTGPDDNRIVRFRLGGALHPILTGLRKGVIHNGGRIAFGPDGKLYAGVGETGDSSLAQDKSKLNGKILRIDPDGTVPKDNPFSGSPIWSYGHRNVQGLAWDGAGRLWATEFGQDRLDEVNLIRKGHDYGWPVREGKGDTDGGKYTNPLVQWPTSEASPSGAAIVGSTLYIGALQGQAVLRVRLHGTSASKESPLPGTTNLGRVRTVVRAPDGALWVATSNEDGRGSPRPGDDRIVRVPLG